MTEQLPILLIVVPLVTALLSPLVAYLATWLLRGLNLAALFVSFLCAVGSLEHAVTEGPWHYYFGGWSPPWGIEYVIDPLSGVMAVLISLLSFLVLFYSGPFLQEEGWLKKGIFHALYTLLTTGFLGMVVTGDVFNLYVFLEISSLSAYALIASGEKKAVVAAFRYLLIGTVGASFYLLGVGYLYAVTGTLNMADLAGRLQLLMTSQTVVFALVLIIVGMGIKMALFPLHGWLPDAYTYGAPAVMPFISGVMTKVMVYVLLRYTYFIFVPTEGFVPALLEVIGWLAAGGIIIASVMAIAQSDFRRMLAYSSVAQIGYIVLGMAIGNITALIGAVLHLLNHAMMKSCLFLAAGSVKWKTGEHTIAQYVEMSQRMPLTMGALSVAALSMIGIPPTAGFFSKWYLVLGAAEKELWVFVLVIIMSSLLNAVYFFRVLEQVYLRKREAEQSETPCIADEAKPLAQAVGAGARAGAGAEPELPYTMLIPIVVLGFGIVLLGVFNEPLISNLLQYIFPGGGL